MHYRLVMPQALQLKAIESTLNVRKRLVSAIGCVHVWPGSETMNSFILNIYWYLSSLLAEVSDGIRDLC